MGVRCSLDANRLFVLAETAGSGFLQSLIGIVDNAGQRRMHVFAQQSVDFQLRLHPVMACSLQLGLACRTQGQAERALVDVFVGWHVYGGDPAGGHQRLDVAAQGASIHAHLRRQANIGDGTVPAHAAQQRVLADSQLVRQQMPVINRRDTTGKPAQTGASTLVKHAQLPSEPTFQQAGYQPAEEIDAYALMYMHTNEQINACQAAMKSASYCP